MSYNIFIWNKFLKIRSGGVSMKKYIPDRNASGFLRLSVIILAILVVALARFYIPINSVVYAIAVVIVAITLFFVCIYIPMYFRSLRYESDGKSITKYGGVFIKYTKSVEFSSVQYTATVSTPFSKGTGLNFAILFVYGGRLKLSFLSYDDIREILTIAERRYHEIS